jgi:hypothetical protein
MQLDFGGKMLNQEDVSSDQAEARDTLDGYLHGLIWHVEQMNLLYLAYLKLNLRELGEDLSSISRRGKELLSIVSESV